MVQIQELGYSQEVEQIGIKQMASKHVFLQRTWEYCWRAASQLDGMAIMNGMIRVLRGNGIRRIGVSHPPRRKSASWTYEKRLVFAERQAETFWAFLRTCQASCVRATNIRIRSSKLQLELPESWYKRQVSPSFWVLGLVWPTITARRFSIISPTVQLVQLCRQ